MGDRRVWERRQTMMAYFKILAEMFFEWLRKVTETLVRISDTIENARKAPQIPKIQLWGV
jgi:hypothetical protein